MNGFQIYLIVEYPSYIAVNHNRCFSVLMDWRAKVMVMAGTSFTHSSNWDDGCAHVILNYK